MLQEFRSIAPEIREAPLAPSLRALANTVPPADARRVSFRPERSNKGGRGRAGRLLMLSLLGALLVLAWRSESSEEKPRLLVPQIVHGQAEPKRSETGAAQHWAAARVVVSIDESVDKLGPWARSSIQQAFGAWLSSGAKVPDLTFESSRKTKVKLAQDGVNSIVYANIDIPGHENDLAVTIAYADPVSGRIVESDIIINKKHKFAALDELAAEREVRAQEAGARGVTTQGLTTERQASCAGASFGQCGGKFDLEGVMAHEVGHFLGLSEDFDDPYTTMFQCTSPCETQKRVLAGPDVAAINALYDEERADMTLEDSAAPAGCVVGWGHRAGSNAALWVLAGALGLLLGRGFGARSSGRRVLVPISSTIRRR